MNQITINKQIDKALLSLFFAFLSFTATAQNGATGITIQNKSISLKEAFAEIERQAGYSIAYEQSNLDIEKRLSLSLKNVSVDKAIMQILKGTRRIYKITGYHIIISSPDRKTRSANRKPQKITQTIRGIVTDSKTNTPIEYATVKILNSPSHGATTDSLGQFRISGVPVGRYDIQGSFVGYNTNIVNEIPITSSKEIYIEILLDENIYSLDEVVIHPDIKKDKPLNAMAITGGRMISMEEAGRFANGFDDPARLAIAFAGVAGEVGTNAIAIRGNSPQYTKWKLEGIEIPNPSHFSDFSIVGGGFLSALNTSIIANSDFYNGAFPAEYDNSLSGVFDIKMRIGNNQKYEHSFLAGVLGLEVASEGPINKSAGSSYIFNMRASNTSLVTSGETNLSYQDLTFKLNFPTKNHGAFSIWGLGIRDRNKVNAETNPTEWETMDDRRNSKDKLEKAMGGVSHNYRINNSTSIHSSLAATYSSDHLLADQIGSDNKLVRIGDVINKNWSFSASSYVNKKFSSRHTNRTDIRFSHLNYDLDYKISPTFGLDTPAEQVSKGSGSTATWSAYTTSLFTFNKHLSATIGFNANHFLLTKEWSLEPRAALKWSLDDSHSVAIAYGLHSQKEKLDYYFVEKTINGKLYTNRDLKLSKAHHVGLSYNWQISTDMVLKIEPYYQYLFNIPVEDKSTFSIINHQEYYLDRLLVNNGAGKNYGVDISLERYMKDGFYYMLTASLFKSKYKGGDNIWRNTRLDKGYILNILTGKEWMIGKLKQNVISINGRLFFQGGGRYTPIDEERTNKEHDIVFDESKAYSKKFSSAVNGDVSFSYRINKKRVSHEFSLKILNVGMRTGMHFYQYNEKTNKIEKKDGSGLIPNISYKIYF